MPWLCRSIIKKYGERWLIKMEKWTEDIVNYLKLSSKLRNMVIESIKHKVNELNKSLNESNVKGYDLTASGNNVKFNLKKLDVAYEEVINKIYNDNDLLENDNDITQEQIDKSVEEIIFAKIKQAF
jgi:galactitol-specific phosphotransferase system IIB component